jgi:N6-L-threonylcarbamoyladenine synthase
MKILAIETSCDETALALIEAEGGIKSPRFKVLKEAVASQIKIHRPFGGVVPALAKREHIKNLPILLRKISGAPHNIKLGTQSGHSSAPRPPRLPLPEVDFIAVTVGPGLEPALWAGISFAEELREKYRAAGVKTEVIGVNHLHGHLYSFLLPSKNKSSRIKANGSFPAIALIVSGGHTILLLLRNLKSWKKLGETRDDAVGEAFDKVARMLNLPYPGGPKLEKLARKGNPEAINFPRPMLHDKSYDFSFSGLKTAVLYYLSDPNLRIHPNAPKYLYVCDPNLRIRPNAPKYLYVCDPKLRIHPNAPKYLYVCDPKLRIRPNAPNMKHRKSGVRDFEIKPDFSDRLKADVAASFQSAAVEVLVKKTLRAAKEFGAKSVMLSGGVAANKFLRKELRRETKKIGLNLLVADAKYNTDNAVMIAAAGYITKLLGIKYPLRANGALNI